ncbi:non-hydrolyzing UDP-N-acetylglucosamine 2-epimerase [uncultured Prochlorococcus sp.]|uniref:non-hydrolyzing UDP-N-acetylglucosamine 2-epimerase n=1 Tax=uncultured Prochlorococcus sp. TaxID=159733 RepID=UPI002583A063|nr:UDP-N-acetylglucosamine 2-epimerase (non-hydrolyzing) [uncultured Prochlorococcus sp.]
MNKLSVITIVLGTRPEAIKLAPIILSLKKINTIVCRVVLTGQHREMVEQVMEIFKIKADNNLEIMQKKQTLDEITSKVLNGLSDEFAKYRPSLILVQGDTSTAFASALSGFYNKIPVGHVEAGLRSNNKLDPFPEEVNRILISQLSDLHFCPTKSACSNLKKNGIDKNIFLTGNTVIDSLRLISNRITENTAQRIPVINYRYLLVTIHRRENWGENLKKIAKAILEITKNVKDLRVILPLHKNQIVRKPLEEILSKNKRIYLTEPFSYENLVFYLKNCTLVLTDSGGLQEEAPTFGKPLLVLRETTERKEAIEAGVAKLVGTDTSKIVEETLLLLNNKNEYEKMSKVKNPFGDGYSSERIIAKCLTFLKTN